MTSVLIPAFPALREIPWQYPGKALSYFLVQHGLSGDQTLFQILQACLMAKGHTVSVTPSGQ